MSVFIGFDSNANNNNNNTLYSELLNHVGMVLLDVCLFLKRRRRSASAFLSAPAPLRHHEALNKKKKRPRVD